MLKILHASDWHLRDKDLDEASRCLTKIEVTAREEAVDLIVIAGDIFDSREIKMDSKAALLAIGFISCLANIAPIAIVEGTPSHEGNAPAILRYARGEFPVFVADRPEQIILTKAGEFKTEADNEGHGLDAAAVITLVPTVTKQYFQTASGISEADQEIGQAMSGLFLGFGAQAAEYKAPHVLLWHGNISGAKIPSGHVLTGQDIEISTDQIRLAGGGNDFVGCFYPGPLYPVKVDEQECGFWVHELDERDFIACMGHVHQPQSIGDTYLSAAPRPRWIPTPFTKTTRFQENFATEEGVPAEYSDQGFLDVSDGPGPGDHEGEHIRYEFTCWQDEVGLINKQGIKERFLQAGALSVDVRITPVPRVTVRAEAVLKAETLRDEFRAMAELRGEEIDEETLGMADMVEGMTTEEILKLVAGGKG